MFASLGWTNVFDSHPCISFCDPLHDCSSATLTAVFWFVVPTLRILKVTMMATCLKALVWSFLFCFVIMTIWVTCCELLGSRPLFGRGWFASVMPRISLKKTRLCSNNMKILCFKTPGNYFVSVNCNHFSWPETSSTSCKEDVASTMCASCPPHPKTPQKR